MICLDRPSNTFLTRLEQPSVSRICLGGQQPTVERTSSHDEPKSSFLLSVELPADRTTIEQVAPGDSSLSGVNSADLKELERFAANFKARRIRLGFTQTNVG